MAPNKLYFVVSFLATAILIWIMLTTVSGRWSREKGASSANWSETGLWRHCQCSDLLENGDCDTQKHYIRVFEGFSILSGIFTGLALTLILSSLFLSSTPSKSVFVGIFLMVALSLASSIITWTAFSAFFKKEDLCTDGEPSFDDLGFELDWGYGMRLVEFGGLAIALVGSLVLTCKAPEESSASNVRYFLFVILLFTGLCTVFTTSGRGWMKHPDLTPGQELEVGLFDFCTCVEVQDYTCSKLKSAFEAAEAFAVTQLFFQFLHVVWVIRGPAQKTLQLVFGGLSTIFIALVWLIYAGSFSEEFCNQKLKDYEKLHWAFGLQVVAFILQPISLLILSRAGPEEAEKVETKPAAVTEPTAAH